MKLRLTIGIIGCVLLALLTPSILNAQTEDYGTSRKIRTCPSRLEPRRGRISVAQAKMYVICRHEKEDKYGPPRLHLIDILSLEIAPKSRPVTGRDIMYFPEMSIDVEKPAYDIRGSIITYGCMPISRDNFVTRGKTCQAYIQPKSSGACYLDTFGDWHCTLGGSGVFESRIPPAN